MAKQEESHFWDMKDKKTKFKELYKFVQLVGEFEKFDQGKTFAPIYVFPNAAPGVAVLFNFDELCKSCEKGWSASLGCCCIEGVNVFPSHLLCLHYIHTYIHATNKMESKNGGDSLERVFADLGKEIKIGTDKQKQFVSDKHIHNTLKRVLLDVGLDPDKSFDEIHTAILNSSAQVQMRTAVVEFLQTYDRYKTYLHSRAIHEIVRRKDLDPDWFAVNFQKIGFNNVFDNPLWNIREDKQQPADSLLFELLGPNDSIFAPEEKRKRKAEELLDGDLLLIRDSKQLSHVLQPDVAIQRHVDLRKQRAELRDKATELQRQLLRPLVDNILVAGVVLPQASADTIWHSLFDFRKVNTKALAADLADWHDSTRKLILTMTTQSNNNDDVVRQERIAWVRSQIDDLRKSRLDGHKKILQEALALPNGKLATALREWSKLKYRVGWHRQISTDLAQVQLGIPLTALYNKLKVRHADLVSIAGEEVKQRPQKRQRTALTAAVAEEKQQQQQLPGYMNVLEIHRDQPLSLERWISDLESFHALYTPPKVEYDDKALKELRQEAYNAALYVDNATYLISFMSSLENNPSRANTPMPRIETVAQAATESVVQFERNLLLAVAKDLNDRSHRAHAIIVESILAKHAACVKTYTDMARKLQDQITQVQKTLPVYEPWMDGVAVQDKFRLRFAQLTGIPHKSIPTTLVGVLAASERWFEEDVLSKRSAN
jgi:hypothetical protein